MLTFEGQKIQGSQNIVAKLTTLPFQQCQHAISTVDCQPSGPAGGMLIFVSGSLKLVGEQHALKFSQDRISEIGSVLGSHTENESQGNYNFGPGPPGNLMGQLPQQSTAQSKISSSHYMNGKHVEPADIMLRHVRENNVLDKASFGGMYQQSSDNVPEFSFNHDRKAAGQFSGNVRAGEIAKDFLHPSI